MAVLDWLVVAGYFVVMLLIGVYAKSKITDALDFYVAGGKLPAWLVGISHHMSGHSAAVFVGYAGRCHSVEATLPVGGGLIGEVHGWREWG